MDNDAVALRIQITLLEEEIKEAFDMRKPFYTKKEMIQRLKLLINELKAIDDQRPEELIHRKESE